MKNINFLLLFLLIILNSCHTPQPIKESLASKNQTQVWESFRNTFQYHIQTIGVSHQKDDNSYIIVISEPAKHTDESGFKKILEDYNSDYKIEKHNIALDGWVKDLVIIMNDLTEVEFESFIDELYEYMYYTSYKSSYLNLPFEGNLNPFLFNDLNYQIMASEINNWFLIDKEQFTESPHSNMYYNLKEIFKQQKSGIYFSVNNGFVAWVLPVNSDISEEKVTIRKFVLDTDLILGAVSDGSFLAIIGRERLNKVYELPPLRIETILLLAAANEDELAQSYERTNLFAGKLPGGKDWAPIYLSDELLNTEYGSLLNITDQMLKSWSLNGDVEYENFMYLKPDHWSFKKGIMEELNVVSLTFNWNTKAAAYSVTLNDYEIVALNRTGSLPISYIPEGEYSLLTDDVLKFEETAYNYFSQLNNPDLVRVVQYATIYQIFKAFDINAIGYYPYSSKPSTWVLGDEAFKLLKRIAMYDESKKEEILEYIDKDLTKKLYYEEFTAEEVDSMINMDEYSALLFDIFKESLIEVISDEMDTLFQTINAVYSEIGDIGLIKLASFIANPRQKISSYDDDEEMQAYSLLANDIISRSDYIQWYPELFLIDRAGIKTKYVSSFKNYFNTWIKTPSIVLSWSKQDSATVVGGHNL
ncbi:MAG: hypothetical protein O6940_05670, partial [Ignavibacteria bacterium]|nr:hypothetical protein [Ignavibacteria bacterium]